MSVPTTLQGTHDGCGGTVVFRPSEHRHELLAGATVTLEATCQHCGATLTTPWSLPAGQQRPAQPLRRQEPLLRSAAPSMRPATTATDPELERYLAKFSDRVESAREHLRQASTDLPSALAATEPGAFRAPKLALGSPSALRSLATAPSAFAAPAQPAAPAPAPAPMQTPEYSYGATAAIATAIASPSFLDDASAIPAQAPQAALTLVPAQPQPAPQIAPTDADVFPPVAAQAAPAPAPAPTQALAVQDSWPSRPGAMPVVAPAPQIENPVPQIPAPATNVAAAAHAPTFAETFSAIAPTVPQPVDASREAAGMPVTSAPVEMPHAEPVPDTSVAFEADRGFDWGTDQPRDAKQRRSLRKGRRNAAAAPALEPSASHPIGPELVFEPAADVEPRAPRHRISLVEAFAIALLAVIAGFAGYKVVATNPPAQTPTTPKATQPMDVTPPARSTATKPKTPGTEVSNPGNGLAAAAAAAQVTAPTADTAGDSSNTGVRS